MASRLVRSLCTIGVIAALAGCGTSSDPGPMGMTQTTIQKASASGDAQSGQVGMALSAPLRVAVNEDGAPKQGATVAWSATGGGSVSPTTSSTGADGIATTTWTLGQAAGAQGVTASLSGASGSPVSFSATATPGPAAELALSDGDNQTGVPSSTLGNALRVKVGDQYGNGVQGETVSWQVTGGDASVQPTSSVSDAGGIAETSVTLGATVGDVTVTATSAGLNGSPVMFHAAAAASSAPSTISVEVGDSYFKSARNNTSNPAVDTLAAGGKVTWTWVGALDHGVESTGSPSFTDSNVMTSGSYEFTFQNAGTYTYICTVHGAVMSGRIVVQ